MKPRPLTTARLSFPLASAIAALLAAPCAHAVNLYWDTNGTGVADSGAATGTWGADAFWSTDSTGLNVGPVTLTAATSGVDDLFFSAGTTGTGGIVTVDGSRTARKLTFEEGAITLSGGTLITLAGGGGLTADTLAGDAIVSTALTINGNNTFNVGTDRILTLDTGAFTRGTRATLNVQGAGTVTSTKSGLEAGGMVNGIIGSWASFGTGATTTYAKFTGSNIVGLGYSGGADGTLAAGAADITDTTGAVNYTTSSITGAATGAGASINTLRYTGSGLTISNTNLLIAKGIMNAGTGALTFGNAVTAGSGAGAGTSATEIVVNTASHDINFNGIVTGAIVKTGSGTMTLSGTPLHSLGAWTVNGGTLVLNSALGAASLEVIPGGTVNSSGTVKLAAGNRVGNGSNFTINEGGVFDTNGQGDQIGLVIGAGSITNTAAANSNLQINPNGGTGTFSGVIGGGAGSITFIVNGSSGTQILSGLNTYTGPTSVRQGILSINSIANVNGGASAIGAPTSATNGTIAIGNATGTNPAVLAYTGPAAETNRVINLNGTSGGATIDQSGIGLLKFTSAFTATGIGSKTLTLRGSTGGTGEIGGAIANNSTTGSTLSTAASSSSTALVLGSVDGLTVGNAISGTGITGGTTISAINTTTKTVTLSAAATVASGATITSTGLVNQTSLAKSGSGTWVLSGNNSYTGATTISGGTLKLSGSGRLGGGTYAGAMSIAPGATFEHASGTQTLSGAITGGGGVVVSGSASGLILTGSGNSYGSLTMSSSVTAGRVFIGNTGALPSAATVAINGGTFVINAAGTYNSPITAASGVGIAARNAATLTNVTLPGSGSVIFNNDDASTSLLTISSDQSLTGALTVQVGGDKMTGSTAALGAVTLSGNLTGNGSLNVTSSGNPANTALFGNGKLTLAGTNTYDGATTVSAGTLFVTGSLTSDVSVSDDATLGGGGTVAAVSLAGGSYFDIALAIGGNALDSTATISFSSTGFGIDNLRFNGAAVDWSTIDDDTYTLITGDLNETNLGNFGLGNAFNIGGGRSAYFKEGSLQLVVIPEPGAALLTGLGVLTLLRRRR